MKQFKTIITLALAIPMLVFVSSAVAKDGDRFECKADGAGDTSV